MSRFVTNKVKENIRLTYIKFLYSKFIIRFLEANGDDEFVVKSNIHINVIKDMLNLEHDYTLKEMMLISEICDFELIINTRI